MTREEAAKLLPIIKAFSEGKTIQYNTGGVWEDISAKNIRFSAMPSFYRIKSEPTYRPFKDAEECWQEMQKHQPFGWIILKRSHYYFTINRVIDSGICVDSNEVPDIFESGFEDYTFADGSVFGVKEE